jgi:transcriptional regulator with XRE-family HTH domain
MHRAAPDAGLFPALLKYWRRRKGLSQLDLGIAADVSARHVSFLETGRAQPSRDMVLRLAAALDVPLRDQNALLRGAGMEPEFREPGLDGALPATITRAIEQMLQQQEPYPLVVMNRLYDVLRTNHAAMRVLAALVADPRALGDGPLNAFSMILDPRLLRPAILEWEHVARSLMWRLHREALDRPGDTELRALLDRLHAMPDVPESWSRPDFSVPSPPAFSVRLRQRDLELGFLTTVTVFNAPQDVTLQELRIESYFPLDDATARTCARLAG